MLSNECKLFLWVKIFFFRLQYFESPLNWLVSQQCSLPKLTQVSLVYVWTAPHINPKVPPLPLVKFLSIHFFHPFQWLYSDSYSVTILLSIKCYCNAGKVWKKGEVKERRYEFNFQQYVKELINYLLCKTTVRIAVTTELWRSLL